MRVIKAACVLGAAALAIFCVLGAPVLLQFPSLIRLLPGQEYVLRTGPFFTVAEQSLSGENNILVQAQGQPALRGSAVGEHSLQLRALGFLPVRETKVQVVPEIEVVPGGEAVGVLLSSSGLLVVRTVPVNGVDGREYYPARDAGIQPGDVIVRIGDSDLVHTQQIEAETAAYGSRGQAVPVEVLRNGRRIHMTIAPVLGHDPAGRGTRYLIGVYLKNPAAGVGTLTFWEPQSRRYGALGHMITGDSREPVVITDGAIVPAFIHGIQPGERGRPGEKMGLFDERGGQLGNIDTNTAFGIFGTLTTLPEGGHQTVPVALAYQVQPGPAEILTVLEGQRVERFSIEVLEVYRQARPSGKGLVIRVTDPRLLRRTNGIVQGMSGSPILQRDENGVERLIGAVTHVYVNNPHMGYGLLAEWMVFEAGIPHLIRRDVQSRLYWFQPQRDSLAA